MTSPQGGRARPSADLGIFDRTDQPAGQLLLLVADLVLLAVAGIALRPGRDLGVARAFNELHTGALGALSSATYNVLEPVPSILLTAVITALFWIVRDLRTGGAFAGVVALTWIPAARSWYGCRLSPATPRPRWPGSAGRIVGAAQP